MPAKQCDSVNWHEDHSDCNLGTREFDDRHLEEFPPIINYHVDTFCQLSGFIFNLVYTQTYFNCFSSNCGDPLASISSNNCA